MVLELKRRMESRKYFLKLTGLSFRQLIVIFIKSKNKSIYMYINAKLDAGNSLIFFISILLLTVTLAFISHPFYQKRYIIWWDKCSSKGQNTLHFITECWLRLLVATGRRSTAKFWLSISYVFSFSYFLSCWVFSFFKHGRGDIGSFYFNHASYTVRCRYNAAIFFLISQNKHSIARPWGRDMGCVSWI